VATRPKIGEYAVDGMLEITWGTGIARELWWRIMMNMPPEGEYAHSDRVALIERMHKGIFELTVANDPARPVCVKEVWGWETKVGRWRWYGAKWTVQSTKRTELDKWVQSLDRFRIRAAAAHE
jgi:hypothetical protein